MKVGIIADTHDNVPRIEEAVAVFNERKVELVVHSGDYIAPFAIAPLDELECQYVGVFGNNDGEKLGLSGRSQDRINVSPHTVELGGKRILIMHDPGRLAALVKSQVYDMISYGHTHEPVIEKRGRTLVINPGECGGWLTGRCTIALADLDLMTAELIELP